MKSGENALVMMVVIVFAAAFIYGLVQRDLYVSEEHPILDEVRERFKILDPEYVKIPLRTGKSSYTDYKTSITLCIINPETGKYYNMDVIMYVALHELAHVITKTKEYDNRGNVDDHGPIFKKNFAGLLRLASSKGIYDARTPIPETYCETS